MTSEKVSPPTPPWYNGAEVEEATKHHEEWRWLPPEKAAFIARHLQLAFSKGFQFGWSEGVKSQGRKAADE